MLELIRFGCSARIASANYYLHLIETRATRVTCNGGGGGGGSEMVRDSL